MPRGHGLNADGWVSSQALLEHRSTADRGGAALIPAGTKVYFAVAPVDLRRRFDGLQATVHAVLGRNPVEGGLFVFLNKRANQLRILFRDSQGWCILAKRLYKGQFRRPEIKDGSVCWETEAPKLMRFLDDVAVRSTSVRASRVTDKPSHLSVVQASFPDV